MSNEQRTIERLKAYSTVVTFLLFLMILGTLRFAGANEILFGAYTHGGVHQGTQPITNLENNLGVQLDVVHFYTNWNAPWPERELTLLATENRTPLISWENTHVTTSEIAAGIADQYIHSWAVGARDHPGVIYLRVFPEMNGSWTPWHGNPEALKGAWQRIVSIFKAEDATNVRFVWSPNVTDEPKADWNRMENYYPGSEYVDVLALDGFNWGTSSPHHQWLSFEDIFTTPIQRVTNLHPTAPIWAAEVASTNAGGDKAQWVLDMFNTARATPRLEAIIWFNENKEQDWRATSSPNTITAFQTALTNPLANN